LKNQQAAYDASAESYNGDLLATVQRRRQFGRMAENAGT